MKFQKTTNDYENRIRLLMGRGRDNENIIRKLQRQLRAIQLEKEKTNA